MGYVWGFGAHALTCTRRWVFVVSGGYVLGAGVGMLELFEGNDASQNMVCTLTWTQVSHNHPLAQLYSGQSSNLPRAPPGTSSTLTRVRMTKPGPGSCCWATTAL